MQQEKSWESSTVQLGSASGKNRILNALLKGEQENMVKSNHDDSLFDISERMVLREKENAKKALEELWLLKKSCRDKDIAILDMLIEYYQKKIDSVRQKEERLKSISNESSSSIEERRVIREELAGVVKEIEDCKREIDFLQAKQEKLIVKEKELKSKDALLMNALENQEKEVLESLQTVILAKGDNLSKQLPVILSNPANTTISTPVSEPKVEEKTAQEKVPDVIVLPQPEVATENQPEKIQQIENQEPTPDLSIYKTYKPAENSRFPKSIVKTDKGRILGEYYYDPKVYKNARHYVFNGFYFVDQLRKGIELFKIDDTNTGILNDLQLMVSDIINRSESRPNIHFEVSTNEVMNRNSLSELSDMLKQKVVQSLDNFCLRYFKKIETLGQNYEQILAEQLANLSNTTGVNG